MSLYRQLAQWRDQQVEYVVMEVSSHAIAQKRIAGLKFEIVALTQVTRDHLDFHASEAEYREVKAHFLSDTPTRYRVINTSDAVGQAVASQASCVGYGYQLSDFARIYSIETEAEGMYVHLAIGDASWQAWVHLYGQFNIENVLCAATCASLLGYGFDQSGYQLRSLKPVAGRMQKVRSEPVVIVDYAHTPDALEKVLQAVREHCVRGKLWVVFGAGGDRDVGKRPLMGQVAERLADHIILTDDNPRSEMAQAIVSDILLGMNAPERAIYIANRAEAIANALKRAEPHDLVLIAGKGHETYQEIAGKRFPFSDIEAVQKCLP